MGPEMQELLLKEEQKKAMKALHAALKPKLKVINATLKASGWRGRRPGNEEPGRGRAGRGRGGGCARGRGHGHGRAHDDSEGEDDDSEEKDDTLGLSLCPSPTRSPSHSPSQSLSPISERSNRSPLPEGAHNSDENMVVAINGHRWVAGNVQFQVCWDDKDITLEVLEEVNDCEAMDVYLAYRDVADPLLLPKRKYLIDRALRALND
ncbi:hypothetical protein C8J57DRAFT_1246078 [Mycena rebaudengoi]|nr:hypothetical protein C8J57DRAFT_1246078 [Mycena rebaudengoi]